MQHLAFQRPAWRLARRSFCTQTRGSGWFPRLESLESRQLLTLDPLTQPRFVNPLTVPGVMQPVEPGGTHYEVSLTQFQQDLGLVDPISGKPLLTTVWGYNGTYPGATFEARRDVPITVRWNNDLTDGVNPLPHLFEVDTNLHWANPKGWPKSGVPTVTHLHGGHTESGSDGLPDAWFTPGFGQIGRQWVTDTYTYHNDQEASTLWYHDHTLGITRLNVYAGLAGFYLVRDDWEESLGLPTGEFEIPLALQDRKFTDEGQLYYPPYGVYGSFGDFNLVNGKAWPFLEVEPRKYRFRLLNGSDSRFYELELERTQAPQLDFFHIGTDNGLLDMPVTRNHLRLAPGERADIVVDFSQVESQEIILANTAGDPGTIGRLMQFRVTRPLSSADKSVVPPVLREFPALDPAIRDRQVLLGFGTMHQLGTVEGGRFRAFDPVTETPNLGDVETWEIYNASPFIHPIHIHLVSFRALNVQQFSFQEDPDTGILTNIEFLGDPELPDLDGTGFKDTIVIQPGTVVRVLAKFDRGGEYVWHCHILVHEDEEMMRPILVGAKTAPGSGDRPPEHWWFHSGSPAAHGGMGSLSSAVAALAFSGPMVVHEVFTPHTLNLTPAADHLWGVPKQVVWHKPG